VPERIVKSAERTLLVFEYFALVRRPASAAEIETALELPQSSTWVLLRSLTDLGYLEYSKETRTYCPTLRVAIFSDWLKPGLSANLVTERLEELRQKTRETVLVGRRQRHQVHYLQILPAGQEVQFYMREGTRRPLCISASGRMLLSTLSDQVVLRIAHKYNAEVKSKNLRIDENHLLTVLKQIRRTGISETDTPLDGKREIHAIATLMTGKTPTEQFSLSVAGPRERVLKRRNELIGILREWIDNGAARNRG
jgi:DNA-binding IclR family transcriptional regulator